MEKILTISVPTYNRAEKLITCLEHIYENDAALFDVVISDNASTDGTEEAVKSFVAGRGIENLRYIRNEENIGPDRNFLQVLEAAQTKYCYLLGDDDFVRPGVIDRLIAALEHKTYSFATFTHTEGEGVTELTGVKSYILSLKEYITFMSFMVFNVEELKSIPQKERFFGTYLLQSFLAVSCIKQSTFPILRINTNPLLDEGENSNAGYNLFSVFIESYYRLCLYATDDKKFSRKTVNRYLVPFTASAYALFKTNGYRRKIPKSTKKILHKMPRYWFRLLPVYHCPTFLLKLLKKNKKEKQT